MKELPSDKYNIAWFKLAEFVARGEKERALALYRLLAHSLDDKALAYQLEGDLLLSFNDNTASLRYSWAAQQYIKQNRLIESAMVYEHLLSLDSHNSDYHLHLIVLYKKLEHSARFIRSFLSLTDLHIQNKKIEKIVDLLYQYEPSMSQDEKSKIYSSLTLELIKKKSNHDFIDTMIRKTIEHLLLDTPHALQLFMTQLQATDEVIYQKTVTSLQL